MAGCQKCARRCEYAPPEQVSFVQLDHREARHDSARRRCHAAAPAPCTPNRTLVPSAPMGPRRTPAASVTGFRATLVLTIMSVSIATLIVGCAHPPFRERGADPGCTKECADSGLCTGYVAGETCHDYPYVGHQCTGGYHACTADTNEECAQAKVCHEDGECTAKDGKCVATDCAKALTCKQEGQCTAKDGKCVAAGTDCAEALTCKQEGRCTAKDGKCVAVGTDCAKALICTQEGRCTASEDGHCWVRDNHDCAEAQVCTQEGRCTAEAPIACIAGKDSDCARLCKDKKSDRCFAQGGKCVGQNETCGELPGCKTGGLCTATRDGQCVLRGHADCERSDLCKVSGQCTYMNGRCIAWGTDCLEREVCKRDGKCTAFDGHCVVSSPTDCQRPGGPCETGRRCIPLHGECVSEGDCKRLTTLVERCSKSFY